MKHATLAVAALLAFGAQAADKARPAAPSEPPQTRELRILQEVMPAYGEADGIGDGGCVTVKFVIQHDGFVGDVTVLEAKPESLAAPTIAALKQWVFQSFPPPDLQAVQTFNFSPELVKLPDTALRGPLAVVAGGNSLGNAGCGAPPKAKG